MQMTTGDYEIAAFFGLVLVFCGFALQSVQYWVAILDIPVT